MHVPGYRKWSAEPAATARTCTDASGHHATQRTTAGADAAEPPTAASAGIVQDRTQRPVVTFQRRTVPSSLPDASHWPVGSTLTLRTRPAWPS